MNFLVSALAIFSGVSAIDTGVNAPIIGGQGKNLFYNNLFKEIYP